MKLPKNFSYRLGGCLILFTGLGHTVGQITEKPSPAEIVVRQAMSQIHPMDIAPNRSLLDFSLANTWLIGLMYFSFGALLLLSPPTRRASVLSAVVSGISAAVAFRYLPLPPAMFLAAATLAFLKGSLSRK
jgi:hypothetical protein